MHELSIAMSLVDAACDELSRLGEVRVEALRVRVGALSGVVPDALLFSFDIAASGTAIEGARLEIENVPATMFCARCNAERAVSSLPFLCCPVCGEQGGRLSGGRELELTALEVSEDDGSHRGSPQERPQEE